MATSYRRWGGAAKMVITVVKASKPAPPGEMDTGSLPGVAAPRPFTGLAQAVPVDGDLRAAFRELMIEPDLEVGRPALRRYVEAGLIRPGNPGAARPALVVEVLWLGKTPGWPHDADDVGLPLLLDETP
ncbi:hypothetical protein ACIBO2_20580 [Nonomuraea sp. NPDC050022]|uniref:hypothetical protein n=1 Tax=unclassified Nonomuraea TaxID=2593643 RepID=UPI0033D6CEBF